MITLVKIGLFLVSSLGYWDLFRRKCVVNLYFVPAFTVAVQFLLLFAAGILNILPEMAILIYGFGLALTMWGLVRDKLNGIKPHLNGGYLFLVAATVLVMLAVRGKEFGWQDSFSHWGLVTKNMLATDGFPNFLDKVVTFQNYPLGSSAYIYYFAKMVNPDEDIQMLAQAFIMLQMILPLYAYIKKNRGLCTVLVALMTNFVMCYNIPITELLVDTMLPLVGMCAVLFIHWHYFDEENPDKERTSIYSAIPLLCFVTQVKNSGALFVLFALVLLVILVKQDLRNIGPVAVVCASVLLVMFIWDRHCGYVFESAAYSKHALTADYLQQTGSDKSLADIQTICKGVLVYMSTRKELFGLIGWMVILAGITCLLKPGLKRKYAALVCFAVMMYVLYGAGMMGMFVFSMPRIAALALECIDRYTKTVDVAIGYLLAAYSLYLISAIDNRRMSVMTNVLFLLMAGIWHIQLGEQYHIFKLPAGSSVRTEIESPIEEYGVQKGYSYLVCSREDHYDMPYFIWKYQMDTMHVKQIVVEQESQMEIEKDYDYVIVLDENNAIIQSWVEAHYPDQAGKRVIQAFK